MLLLETEGQTPDGSVRERQIAVEWRLQQEKQVSAHSFVLSWDEINVKVHFVCVSHLSAVAMLMMFSDGSISERENKHRLDIQRVQGGERPRCEEDSRSHTTYTTSFSNCLP